MTISTVKDLYLYLVKGMLKLLKNVGMTDEDIKKSFSIAQEKFKELDLEDKDKVNEICNAVDEGLKDGKN